MLPDLLLSGGLLVDGCGRPPHQADVGVSGGRVQLQPSAHSGSQSRVVDVTGCVVCPGFIDIHTHSDWVALLEPRLEASLRQGVTTVVVGNCGQSPTLEPGGTSLRAEASRLWGATTAAHLPALADEIRWHDVGGYLDAVEARRPALNVAALVGFGTIRRSVMGDAARPASREERRAMRRRVAVALESGAWGLSSGLIYDPDRHATTEELCDVAMSLGDGDGLYASHVRGEGPDLMGAVAEAIEVGRAAACPVQVSHLKLEGADAWGRAAELLDLIRQSREDGVDVAGDQYPYTAYETGLVSFLPPGASEPASRAGIRGSALEELTRQIEQGLPGWQSSVRGVGWARIEVVGHEDPDVRGRSIADLAEVRGCLPVQVVLDLLGSDSRTSVVGHAMRDADVAAIMAAGDVSVASDGVAWPTTGPLAGRPGHPRSAGTFPRVLGRYARDLGVLDLAGAIRKMTALPAARLGLRDRGSVVDGAVADLTVIDPAAIIDRATYTHPHLPPDGVILVLVGGQIALEGGRLAGRHGQVLRRR